MVLDKYLEFDDTRAALTASAISTNVVDLGATNLLKDLGSGYPIWFVVQVDTTGTGTGTVVIALVSGGDVALQTTPVTHIASPAIVGTNLVAGAEIIRAPLPSQGFLAAVPIADNVMAYKQYLGVQYTISGTVGAVQTSAFLLLNPQMPQASGGYVSGFTF
jgi:hypothetical protein